MQDQVPPQNIEAEQSVLGAMLIDNTAAIFLLLKCCRKKRFRFKVSPDVFSHQLRHASRLPENIERPDFYFGQRPGRFRTA